MDSKTRRFVTVNIPENTDRDPSVGFSDDAELWGLSSRAFCEERNRSYFSVLSVQIASEYCGRSATVRFESNKWRVGDSIDRGSMMVDLLCGGHLLGLGAEEVGDLLGPPDDRPDGKIAYRVYSEELWDYVMSSTIECEENLHDLEFDYSIVSPSDGAQVFRRTPVCDDGDG